MIHENCIFGVNVFPLSQDCSMGLKSQKYLNANTGKTNHFKFVY